MLYEVITAGKSALMRTIMGFSEYRVVKGRILFKGEDITHLPIDERARRGLVIMMQRPPDMVGSRITSYNVCYTKLLRT